MTTLSTPLPVRWELWHQGRVRAAAVPADDAVACLLWTGERFETISQRFRTDGGAMRYLRRRVGGGTWHWVREQRREAGR
jgi:hypothetical protein